MDKSAGQTPAVSVIVPVYNVEKYLSRCIDSILAQSFSDFELILIDDGSRDNSGKICDEYASKDTRIIVIHKINQGVSAARNDGLDNARGKYISFVDSDDYINPDYLEQMVAALESDNADLAICDISLIAKGEFHEVINCKFPEGVNLLGRDEVLKNIVQYSSNGYSPLWNKLYKREVIEQHHLRIPLNLSFGEDLIFNISYFKVSSYIRFINVPLYNYVASEFGLYNKYRPDYISDCMLCRRLMLEELKEYEFYDPGFTRLNKKFMSDIVRHISQIYKHETNPRKLVAACYKNPEVIACMRQLLDRHKSGDTTALTDVSQIRIAKLIKKGYVYPAIEYTDYLNNPRNILRRLIRCYKLVKTLMRDNNLRKIQSYKYSKYQSGGGKNR